MVSNFDIALSDQADAFSLPNFRRAVDQFPELNAVTAPEEAGGSGPQAQILVSSIRG